MTTLGSTSYTQIAYSRGWSHDNGRTVTITYKGPRAGLRTFYDGLEASPGAIDAVELDTADDGTAVVRVTYQDTDETGGGGMIDSPDNDIWELIGQDLEKDVRDSTLPVGGVSVTGVGAFDFTTDAVQAALSGVWTAYQNNKLWSYGVSAGTAEAKLKNLLLRNRLNFYRSAIVLRKTLRFSRRTSLIVASWKGVDRAWPTGAGVGAPNPTGVGTSKLLAAFDGLPGYNAAKRQWLKRAPQLTLDGRKYSLAQEWWYAERWSNQFYDGDQEVDGTNP